MRVILAFKQRIMVALLLFIVAPNGYTTPMAKNEGFKYEEYIIEHEISSSQARNAALVTNLKSMLPPPGCHECTSEEIRYCLGADLINDHCCCDLRYHELLPFIPHTCYVGTQLCQTVASNCDEYRRLHSCCCQKHAYLKWVSKSDTSSTTTTGYTSALLISILFYLMNG